MMRPAVIDGARAAGCCPDLDRLARDLARTDPCDREPMIDRLIADALAQRRLGDAILLQRARMRARLLRAGGGRKEGGREAGGEQLGT